MTRRNIFEVSVVRLSLPASTSEKRTSIVLAIYVHRRLEIALKLIATERFWRNVIRVHAVHEKLPIHFYIFNRKLDGSSSEENFFYKISPRRIKLRRDSESR